MWNNKKEDLSVSYFAKHKIMDMCMWCLGLLNRITHVINSHMHDSILLLKIVWLRRKDFLGSVHYLCEGGGKNEGGASNFCVARKGGICNFLAKRGMPNQWFASQSVKRGGT